MPAPEVVRQLVQRFEEHLEAYRSGKYNETQLRREFLDPFFEALGWDVLNKLGYSEENKHVIHEDSLDVEGVKKAPDYAFKVGRERKFFVEAKKPFVKIETNTETAFQLRRYVWSAKLPLGILTDFEEFAVYECRSKPKVSDSVKTGRVLMFRYTDYVEKWDEIASIFSYKAVMKGGFDKYAGSAIKKKGTAEVDEAFLDEIEGWRETLARNIALRNRDKVHNEADLNYAVQMTIDRIIFLRICEERGFEPENQLQSLAKHEDIYEELRKLFEKADKRYNSGLFHFKEEKGRGRADAFTMGLEIDDKVLKDIIKDLYYPSPYVFSQIPADILGQIYEQFLGKVIRLTAGGNAKVEEKPEVRKAGGVFYTPTFIVDYIVANTLGKLLDPSPVPSPNKESIWRGGMPEQAAKLKIVDPACGSGTFLLGAYQYLLDWHLNWYLNHDFEKWSKGKRAVLVQGRDGWRLNVEKKKEILLNNIYGVDIDPQAVEVTKLSLLLKVIEDPGQLSYLDERILPDLGRNIQCGNSLIGPDYWEGALPETISEEDRVRVNTFDWKTAFPEVFAQGGFDAVVGNPPYVRMEGFSPIKDYLKKHYSAHEERADFYTYFIELASKLINDSGIVGMIVSNKFSVAKYGKPLRAMLQSYVSIREITDFAGTKVFKGATVRTFILFFSRLNSKQNITTRYIPVPAKEEFEQIEQGVLSVSEYANRSEKYLANGQLTDAPWELVSADQSGLLNRLKNDFPTLRQSFDWKPLFGIKTGFNEAFVVSKEARDKLVEEDASSSSVIQPILFGRDVKRYSLFDENRFVIYLHPNKNPDDFVSVKRHLETYRSILSNRAASQKWYELQQPAVSLLPHLAKPKIVYPIIAPEPRFTLDIEGYLINDKLFVLPTNSLYLLGLLNSSLANFFFSSICARLEGQGESYYEFRAQFVERFPVRQINFSDPADKARHDKMVTLVERMLALHKSLASAHNPQEADRLTREIESMDREIDRLVYELYGLSEEEIEIVEE